MSFSERLSQHRFQCSSASRKFLKRPSMRAPSVTPSFSALQRAENSSMYCVTLVMLYVVGFSALQRAENSSNRAKSSSRFLSSRFSALQRAENSSTG